MKKIMDCPCFSGSSYNNCCAPYHQGKDPENASILMRARFSAYALGLADFIIHTTTKESTTYREDKEVWGKNIQDFHQTNRFKNLEIIDFKEHSDIAFVTFIITLEREGQVITYTERSCFLLQEGKWLFQDSLLMDGKRSAEEMEKL